MDKESYLLEKIFLYPNRTKAELADDILSERKLRRMLPKLVKELKIFASNVWKTKKISKDGKEIAVQYYEKRYSIHGNLRKEYKWLKYAEIQMVDYPVTIHIKAPLKIITNEWNVFEFAPEDGIMYKNGMAMWAISETIKWYKKQVEKSRAGGKNHIIVPSDKVDAVRELLWRSKNKEVPDNIDDLILWIE